MPQQTPRPLAGRTAIVTGSGRNIGRAILLRFAQAGADVVVNGHRDVAALERVAAEAEALGVRAQVAAADVSDPAQVAQLVARARERFGGVDIAVSNVGLRRHHGFLDISLSDWRETLDTNLSSCFYLAREVLPGMIERGWGRLIHISGIDGFTGHITHRADNLVCKAGMHGLTRALAKEFGHAGITCNTVVPGSINTQRDWSQYPNQSREEWIAEIPVGRLGEPEDIAEACYYVVGPGGAFVNGQALHLNGGEFTP
ncbi:MAG: SDR family oxidoreductase [Alphaproteobacteria bacterium]|nr:SDR family oxidoreductase [Alphaproteobacteria bacterium]